MLSYNTREDFDLLYKCKELVGKTKNSVYRTINMETKVKGWIIYIYI